MITIAQQPTVTLTVSNLTCGITTATAQVTGGASPYTYSWSGGSASSSIATFSTSGIYSVTVYDQGSCPGSTYTTVVLPVITTTVNHNNNLCFGQNTATANIVILGGSGNYFYVWSNGSINSPSTTLLGAGAYTVTVYDITCQCSIIRNFTITQPPSIILNISQNLTSACVGQSVIATATASGGTSALNYSWNTGSTQPSISITQTTSGNYNYSCTITDANLCSMTKTLSVIYFAYPAINCTNTMVCLGNSVTLYASGAISYTWLPGNIFSSSLSLLPNTNSSFTVSGDSNGCVSTTTVNVVVNPLPVVNLSSNSPLCMGQNLILNSGSQTGYLWIGPSSFSSSIQNPTLANVGLNQGGIYTLSVTDNNNCSSSASLQVIVNPLPIVSILGNQTICVGQNATLTASGAVTYSWSSGNTNNSFIIVSPNINTNYTVTGTLNTGCSNSANISLTVLECTGIEELMFTKGEIKIYPNPAYEILNVELGILIEGTHLNITNLLGQEVMNEELQIKNSTLNIQHLKAGIYFVRINNNVLKFVKE